MPAKLSKSVTRLTDLVVDGKTVQVTLNPDNTLELRLRGDRSNKKTKIINLIDLFGENTEQIKEQKPLIKKDNIVRIVKEDKKEPLVNLYWLRSQNAISALNTVELSRFDGLIKGLIDDWKRDNEKI